MSTNEIHFIKNFKKLHNQEWANILNVIVVKGWELTDKFKKYDTEEPEKDQYETDEKFVIDEEQKYLLIFLMGDKFIPFTTIRKFNDENILKYCSPDKCQANFKIVIDEEIK